MVTWDNFQEQLNRTNHAIDKVSGTLEKMRVSFESLTRTYQDLIDYCKKIQERE